jgi:hypothetical protein
LKMAMIDNRGLTGVGSASSGSSSGRMGLGWSSPGGAGANPTTDSSSIPASTFPSWEDRHFVLPEVFIRPFRDDVDSRNEYRGPVLSGIYNERERCYDEFSNLLHSFLEANRSDISGERVCVVATAGCFPSIDLSVYMSLFNIFYTLNTILIVFFLFSTFFKICYYIGQILFARNSSQCFSEVTAA